MRANLVKSETLPIFVMANSENVGSRITYKPYNKAGSLSDDLVPTSSRCLPKQPRGLASFVTYATNFFPKMANSEKVSAGAQGASIATVSARNSAFSKPVQAHSTKRYYQVSIYAKRIDICVANLHCSHPFLATSREEAIGMACARIKERWPKYFILAEDIVCQPLNLKSCK